MCSLLYNSDRYCHIYRSDCFCTILIDTVIYGICVLVNFLFSDFQFFAKRRQQKSIDHSDTDEKVMALIDRYMNEEFDFNTIDSINPIDYWIEKQLNKDQQPLADVALDILPFSASSAGCERLFS